MDRTHRPSTNTARREANKYLSRLFEKKEAVVVVSLGQGGTFNERGSYKFTLWRPLRFQWPSERSQLLDDALGASRGADVYIMPTLRRREGPSQKESCKMGRYAWVDIDRVTAMTEDLLADVWSEGSFVVRSGRGLHAYVRLNKWYGPKTLERVNKGLSQYLAGDSKWASNSFLRLPGTKNHKGRARGKRSFPVVLEDRDFPCFEPWSPGALLEITGEGATVTKGTNSPRKGSANATPPRPARRTRQAKARTTYSVDPEPLPDPLPTAITERLRWEPKSRRQGDTSRSGLLFGLIGQALREGFTDGQCLQLALYHEPAQEKWPEESELREEVERILGKIRPEHPHPGRTCTASRCPTCPDPKVAGAVEAIMARFHETYHARTLATDTKVLTALCDRARQVGNVQLGMSLRDLGIQASIANRGTTSKSLKRLEDAGYLKKVRLKNGLPDRKGNSKLPVSARAEKFRLLTPPTELEPLAHRNKKGRGNTVHALSKVKSGSSLSSNKKKRGEYRSHSSKHLQPQTLKARSEDLNLNDDMWRYRGVASCFPTYEALVECPGTTKEIASRWRRPISTVRRHLKLLEGVGLVNQDADGIWRSVWRDPKQVGAELEVLGDGKKQRVRDAREREGFQEMLRETMPSYAQGAIVARVRIPRKR